MKIGIFDSGLGGLLMAKVIRKELPEYDYVYLGDTKRVPYGNRSFEAVLEFTRECVSFLFEKENCGLVIIACNTASARALAQLQKEFSDKKILGVLIPAVEECVNFKKVGIIATEGTVSAGTFSFEINKLNPKIKVYQNSAPMLVPLVEAGEEKNTKYFLEEYINPLLKKNINALVLGCTHYPLLKKEIKKILPENVFLLSQDEIVPRKTRDYLNRHPEIENKLSKNKTIKILVTDETKNIKEKTKKWFGLDVKTKVVKVSSK
jgi:glutamate racemase